MRKISEADSVTIALRVSPSTKEKLNELASFKGQKLSEYLRDVISALITRDPSHLKIKEKALTSGETFTQTWANLWEDAVKDKIKAEFEHTFEEGRRYERTIAHIGEIEKE